MASGSGQEAAGVQMVPGERSGVCGCIREGKLWKGQNISDKWEKKDLGMRKTV